MAKAVKIILYSVLALLILVAVGAVALSSMVDPNDYKDQIVAQVKSHTGRDLRLEDDLSLSFFPWMGIEMGAMELGNAPGFGSEPFAKLNSLEVRVKLLPLLSRRMEVATLKLKGLTLNLAKDATGRSNWQDLGAGQDHDTGSKQAHQTSQKGASAEASEAVSPLEALVVGGVEVHGGVLNWSDAQSGASHAVEGFFLEMGRFELNRSVPLAMGFNVTLKDPVMTGTIRMESQMTVDLKQQRYRFEMQPLSLALSGPSLPNGSVEAALKAVVDADMASEKLTVGDLKVQGMGLDLTGSVEGTNILTEPQFRTDLSMTPFNLRKMLGKLGVVVEAKDATALTQVGMALTAQANTEAVDISTLAVDLDGSKLAGTFSVQQFDNPALRFSLHLDALDVDRYLPAGKAASGAKATPKESLTNKASASSSPSEEMDLAPLRTLNLDGSLKVDSLKASGARIRNLTVVVKAEQGMIRVSPLRAQLYRGALDAAVTADARGKRLAFHVRPNLKGIQAGPLLSELADVKQLRGTLNAKADLTFRGLESAQINRTLSGRGHFAFTDGALVGINVARLIRNAYHTFRNQPLEPEGAFEKTDFTSLNASVRMNNGAISNQDLKMVSPLLRITGKGSANLPKDRINYVVSSGIVGSLKGQGGESINELKDAVIPIKLYGRLSAPDYTIDMETFLKENLKTEAKKKVQEKLKKALGDKIPAGIGEQLLKGLF
ncbi:MAG: AsmA family protein [Magnetococcales bacterium]|nr:AsmA family protein [Magnetococcales bacterium]